MAFVDNRTPKGLAEEIRELNGLTIEKVYVVEHCEDYYRQNGYEGYSNIYFSAGVDVKELKLPEGFRYDGSHLVKRHGNGTFYFKVVQ